MNKWNDANSYLDENGIRWYKDKDGNIRPKCILERCNGLVPDDRYEKGWFTCEEDCFNRLRKNRIKEHYTTPGLEDITAEKFKTFYISDTAVNIGGKWAYLEGYWIGGEMFPVQDRKTGKYLAPRPMMTTETPDMKKIRDHVNKLLTQER